MVYEDIAFGLLHLSILEEEINERVEWALNLLGIEEIKNKHLFI
jgi:energy-coupling factor transporter ATP-binding protein EcfA2